MSSGRARSFSLIEVVAAFVITAVALVHFQAAVSGSMLSAGDSITQRIARERAVTKLEEIRVGLVEPDTSGNDEEYPEISWQARSEEQLVGVPEHQSEAILLVTLDITYPSDTAEGGQETFSLATIIAAEEE